VSRSCSSICHRRAISFPEAFLLSLVLSLLRDERRHDAPRRFPSVVSCGFPGLMFAKWNLLSASHRYASRRLASVCQRRVLWLLRLMFASSGILSRRDVWRRFASVVSCGFPGVWILCRLRDDRRCDPQRRFTSVLSCGFPWIRYAFLESWVVVATTGGDLPASCLVAFLTSSAQKMTSCVSVATPTVGALVVVSDVSCRMSFRGSRIVEYYRRNYL
jgi:hypothetical protein